MAATLVYNKLAAILGIKIAKALPVLKYTRQQASDKVFDSIGANGETMLYALPDYGTVGDGGSISEAQMAYTAGSVPLTLHQKNIPFSTGQLSDTDLSGSVRDANEILDMAKEVEIPLAGNLGHTIQRNTLNTACLGAGSAFVVGSGSTIAAELANATAAIEATYSDDDKYGAIGPKLRAEFSVEEAKLFNPSTSISKLYLDKTIGHFSDCDWLETPDAKALATGTLDFDTAGLAVSSYTAATNTLVLAATTLTGTVKAGTPFVIDGINQVDVFGNDTGTPFTFVAQADATASSNSVSIVVQPVATSGALCNVTALPATSDTVSAVLAPSKTYNRAVVWAKPGIGTGFGRMSELEGAKNFKFESGEAGLWFYGVKQGDVVNRRNIWRLDVLTGSVVTRSNWVSVVFKEQ
jgi:hypothetical protein